MRNPKVLFLHSNKDELTRSTHLLRIQVAKELDINIEQICIADYIEITNFRKLDIMYRFGNNRLYKFYELLEDKFKSIDVLIHFNGAGLHPDFLKRYNFLKIYHCADDPDASKDLSMPVANYYDIQAIANPSCINDYKVIGCKNVFFWPLGAQFFNDMNPDLYNNLLFKDRNKKKLLFIGDSYGIPKNKFLRYIPLFFKKLNIDKEFNNFYTKKQFFIELENKLGSINGFGNGWLNGYCSKEKAIDLYKKSMFGINKHNSGGPINFRLYDLAAFGVCQFCDCKETLDLVFKDGEEIIGYSSIDQFIDLYKYYFNNINEAEKIAQNAHKRYLKDYTNKAIWEKLNNKVYEYSGIKLI